MPYTIEFLRPATKQLKRIDKQEQPIIWQAVMELADDPRPNDCKKLKGSEFYRIRVGDYCIIYDIQDKERLYLS